MLPKQVNIFPLPSFVPPKSNIFTNPLLNTLRNKLVKRKFVMQFDREPLPRCCHEISSSYPADFSGKPTLHFKAANMFDDCVRPYNVKYFIFKRKLRAISTNRYRLRQPLQALKVYV